MPDAEAFSSEAEPRIEEEAPRSALADTQPPAPKLVFVRSERDGDISFSAVGAFEAFVFPGRAVIELPEEHVLALMTDDRTKGLFSPGYLRLEEG